MMLKLPEMKEIQIMKSGFSTKNTNLVLLQFRH